MPYDTAGQYHPFFDMCGYCRMTTGGQHEPHCPLFQPQMIEGYKVNAELNIKFAEEALPLFKEVKDEQRQ